MLKDKYLEHCFGTHCDECSYSNGNETYSVGCAMNYAYDQGRMDAIEEFISNVLQQLNAIATDDGYYFDQDNANLVSSVLFGQFEWLKEKK